LATVEQLILHEKRGNCVPVYVEVPADLITPCMAYLRIAKDSKYSFLLESVVGGENIARYSFIGAGEFALRRQSGSSHAESSLPLRSFQGH
jgi:anthranilate synthase component 1